MNRRIIDWQKTSKNLKLLRCDNLSLRREICKYLRSKDGECDGDHCPCCRLDMETAISQAELADFFKVSESVVANWETARSEPSVEDLLFYADLCGLKVEDIVVFRKEGK